MLLHHYFWMLINATNNRKQNMSTQITKRSFYKIILKLYLRWKDIYRENIILNPYVYLFRAHEFTLSVILAFVWNDSLAGATVQLTYLLYVVFIYKTKTRKEQMMRKTIEIRCVQIVRWQRGCDKQTKPCVPVKLVNHAQKQTDYANRNAT